MMKKERKTQEPEGGASYFMYARTQQALEGESVTTCITTKAAVRAETGYQGKGRFGEAKTSHHVTRPVDLLYLSGR